MTDIWTADTRPPDFPRITDAGDIRITDGGRIRVTEDNLSDWDDSGASTGTWTKVLPGAVSWVVSP